MAEKVEKLDSIAFGLYHLHSVSKTYQTGILSHFPFGFQMTLSNAWHWTYIFNCLLVHHKMLKYLLLLSFCVIAIAQEYDEYGEEYFYQDYYDEEYPYDYNDGIDDYKVVIPTTTTQRPTTTTRRPYYYTTRRTTTIRTTTRPPYYYTTTTSRPTR